MVDDWVIWVIFGLCILITIMLIAIIIAGAILVKEFNTVKTDFRSVRGDISQATGTIDRVRSVLDLLENLLKGNGTRAMVARRLA